MKRQANKKKNKNIGVEMKLIKEDSFVREEKMNYIKEMIMLNNV